MQYPGIFPEGIGLWKMNMLNTKGPRKELLGNPVSDSAHIYEPFDNLKSTLYLQDVPCLRIFIRKESHLIF